MLSITSALATCERKMWRGIDKRDPRIAEYILVHRNDVGRTPEALADFFQEPKNGTGGRFPYHFFIARDGTAYQCAPLSVATPGARGANRAGIQICLDGDFRKTPPEPAQLQSCTELVAMLLRWNPSLKVQGHTDIPGRSADADKVCPGKFLPTGPLRIAALERLEREAKGALRDIGVKF